MNGISICFMPDTEDTNAAVWKSDIGVSFWKSTQADREQRRAGHRALLAELLPFAADEPFTVVDLGAGTGAAARIILDHYPAAHAILADFSPQMMAQGEVELDAVRGPVPLRRVRPDEGGRLAGRHSRPGRRRDQLAVGASSQRRPQADAVRGDPARTSPPAAGT